MVKYGVQNFIFFTPGTLLLRDLLINKIWDLFKNHGGQRGSFRIKIRESWEMETVWEHGGKNALFGIQISSLLEEMREKDLNQNKKVKKMKKLIAALLNT
jgi:hypothetical protein